MSALHVAIVAAQAAARAVSKGSENKHHGYAYAGAEDIIAAARVALGSAGLALITTAWEPHDGRLHVTYLLIHGESGDTLPLATSTPVIPDRGRPQDKAEAAALTLALSYLLRGLLLLPRVDAADDINARDDRHYDPAAEREAEMIAALFLERIRQGERGEQLAADIKAASLPARLLEQVRAAYAGGAK